MGTTVAIVGAGKGGTSILKTFSAIKQFKIVGICDRSETAPGIVEARNRNISTFTDIKDLLQIPGIDVIIEATGVQAVRDLIYEHKAPNTVLIDSHAANIMMVLVEAREEMIHTLQEKASNLVENASSLSDASTDIEKLVEKIAQVTNNIIGSEQQVAATIADVVNQVQESGKILDFINTIAQQTKMLGLNAAIEAARAGEQGRGFVVVAEEVRKLAEQSNKSVGQIEGILNGIREAASVIARQIQESEANIRTQAQTTEGVIQETRRLQTHLDKMAGDMRQLAQELASFGL